MYPLRFTAFVLMLFFGVNSYGQFISNGIPQAFIEPDTVLVNLNHCSDSAVVPVTISNTGTGSLLYNVVFGEGVTDPFENGLSDWILEGAWGLSTYAFEGNYSLAVNPSDYYGNNWLYSATYAEELQVFDASDVRLNFDFYYDLYCCGGKSAETSYYCDQVIAQISVNGGDFQDIYSVSCSYWDWQNIDIDLAAFVSNGDRFIVRFLFYSDDYGTGYGAFVDNFHISGAGPQVSWLNLSTQGGLILPGDEVEVSLLFKGQGVVSGQYSAVLPIETNDTAVPVRLLYVELNLQGDPQLEVSLTVLDFGDVPENAIVTDTLILRNTGCDSLHFSGFTLNNDRYSIDSLPEVLPAFTEYKLGIRFNPDSVGPYTGTLNLLSDGGTQSIDLSGLGIASPRLVISPGSFLDSLSSCGDSVLVSFTVYNEGLVNLDLQIEPEISSMAALTCIPENYDYDCCGFGIYRVELGSINHSSGSAAEELNQDFTASQVTTLAAGVSYPVRITTGTENYENVRIWIDYNSDGTFDSNELVFESLNNFSGIHEGLISIPEVNVALYTRLRMRVASEYMYYSIPEACGYVYYGQYEDYTVVVTGATPAVVAANLLPGDSMLYTFYANTTGLTQGLHPFNRVITSNDPLANPLLYPVSIWLEGNPEIGLSAAALDFDTLSQSQTAVRFIEIFNTGCAPLVLPEPGPVNGLTASFDPEFGDTVQLMPGDTLQLRLEFSSAVPGEYSGILPLLNSGTDTSLAFHATMLPAAFPDIIPDSFQANLTSCTDSLQLALMMYNHGQDSLHWYTAENNAGNALSFPGLATQEICIDSVGSLPVQGTLEFWFTQDYTNYWDNMGLISVSVNDFTSFGAGFDIRYYYDNLELVAGDSSGNYQYFSIRSYIPKNQWNHVAVSWDRDADSLWIYFNGQLVQSVYAYYETIKPAGLCMGRSGSSLNLFKGKLDEVRLWEVKRSPAQISAFFQHSVSAELPGLRAFYNMNEESGTTVYDQSAHAFHGELTDVARVLSGIPFNSNVEFSPLTGSIAPGDSAQMNMLVKANGLAAGQHSLTIPIETNAPAAPLLIPQLELQVQGNPEIGADPAVLAFDSLMVGLEVTDTLMITNPGCDTLFITGVVSLASDFQASPDTLAILPFDSATLLVRFKPLSAGFMQDSLRILSNAGTLMIPVSGTGLAAPNFVFSPDTVFLVSTACDVPVSGSVQLSNTGAVAASYSNVPDPGFFLEDFENGLSNWETQSTAFAPNGSGYQSAYSLYFYSSYNSTLNHSIDLKVPLQVRNPDSVFVSADILQNLACSWYGYDYLIFYVSKNGSDWEAVYSLTCSNYNFQHRSFQLTDINEGDLLRFRIALSRYGYYSYVYGNLDNFRVSGVSMTPGFETGSFSGVLQPDSSVSLTFSFTNTHLQLGRHTSVVSVQTSSPVQPVIKVPVVVDFQGEAHSLSLTDTLDFGYRMATSTTVLPLMVKNTGCDTLEMLSVHNGNPAFTAVFAPESVFVNDLESVDIEFHPLTPGFYLDTLVILTNAEPVSVILRGNAGPAPHLQHSPDSLLIDASCGDVVNIQLDLSNSGDTSLSWIIDPLQADGLLFYYPFQGDVHDYSGNNRHLTDVGTLAARGLEDHDSTARLFTGTQSLQYTNDADIGANLFVPYASLSLWVNADSIYADYYQKLFFLNYGLDISISSGIISAYASGTNSEYFSLEAPFLYDHWVHVAVTFDGLAFRLFLNGNPAAEAYGDSCVLEYYSYNKRVDLGNQSGYNSLHGMMDEVRFYDRALSSAEVQSLYTSILQHYLVYQANPSSGSLNPGASGSSVLSFNTSWLKAGTHQGFIPVSSNDPENNFIGIPYRITVSGEPSPQMPVACTDFGSVFVNEQKTDSLLLINEGCDELVLTALYTGSGQFFTETGPVTVAPFNSRWIRVSFLPGSAGTFTDTLYLASNAGLLQHCLSGSSAGKPSVQVNSGLFTRILTCTNTATDEIQVMNTGNQTLEVNLIQGPVLPWLSIPVTSLSVAPGQQGIIPLEFSRMDMGSGVYTTTLQVQTNDPDYPAFSIQVHLLIANTFYTANLGNDTAFCAGTSYLLNPGYFSTYLWNTGAVTPSISITEPGVYSVSVSDISGCLSNDTIQVEMVNAPVVYAGSDTMACTGQSFRLNARVLNPLPLYPKTALVGQGSYYTNGVDANPMSTAYSNRQTQYFYEAYELINAGLSRGMLTSLAFNLAGTDGVALNDYTVRIAFVSSYNTSAYFFLNNLTQVFHANTITPVNGWNVLQFDTSLYWDGNQHMVVQICHNNSAFGNSPEYLYSYKYRGTLTNYCSYCGDLCNSGGYGYIMHYRPVLKVGMDVDINAYTWTGPSGFYSQDPEPLILSIESYDAGTYQLTIDNGYGCTGTDEVVITVNPSPVLDLGPDQTLLGWDTTPLHAGVSAAPGPYSFSWSPSTGLDNPDSAQVQVFINQSITYTVDVVSANGCTDQDQITLNVIPRFPLSGKLTYANVFQTPLPQSTVYRLNGELQITDSASTNASGDYEFPLLPVNTNHFAGTSELTPGGINATDALLVARHITGSQVMSGVRLQAADVNGSKTWSAADALLILHRTAGNISTFPAGEWTVEKRSVNHQAPSTVVNLTALSFGDVNGSFTPGLKAEPTVSLRSDDFVLAAEKELIPVPIKLASDVKLGALTLSLGYDPEWLKVEAVSSPLEGLVSHIGSDQIRLAWYDVNGQHLKHGDVIAILWIVPDGKHEEAETAFRLGEDAELADAEGRIQYDKEIRIPRIRYENEPQGIIYLGQNQPNPFTEGTVIPFSIPEEGMVRFDIYTLLGEQVLSGTGQQYDSGAHYWPLNASGLKSGMYLYRFTFKGKTLDYQQTRTLILNR